MAAVRSLSIAGLAWLLLLVLPTWSWAHGFAGQRFFPTTLAVDDPFVSDELSFELGHTKEPRQGEEPPTGSTEFSVDYTKRITPRLGLSLGGSYLHLNPEEGSTENGFGNLDVGAKYQLLTLASAEALFSFGLTAEVGGTGARSVGADSVSTLSPSIFFGKGFGDLPATVPFLKPFALTGAFAANIPARKQTVTTQVDPLSGDLSQATELHPMTFSWGLTLQYNLQYLQSFVKDVGLGVPFNRMIPLIEFPMETCLNRGCGGQTTGTINPGIIWFGKYIELGAEATIPINSRSGKNVGALFLVHFFIDDLFPHSLGGPLFP
jgi:hypothetical protein